LAREIGCRVVGVDVSAIGHAQAETRALEGRLGNLVEFRLGDIRTVDLTARSVDAIIGLDAWCHIPQRAALFRRCAELLRPGGRVFLDHIGAPAAARGGAPALESWHFADLETPRVRSYIDAIEAAGLDILFGEDTSAHAVRFSTRVLDGYRAHRTHFEAARGVRTVPGRTPSSSDEPAPGGRRVLGQFGCIAVKPPR
jgi:cyclopropane fatty-acyl-phospholipid synthase-like methyltransferase